MYLVRWSRKDKCRRFKKDGFETCMGTIYAWHLYEELQGLVLTDHDCLFKQLFDLSIGPLRRREGSLSTA